MLAFVFNAGFRQITVSAFTMHDQWLPPPPPAPPLAAIPGLIEAATMGWPVASFLHKKAPTVLVDGNPGIQQGHDVGYGIPHFAIPLNAFCLLHTGLSKHKVMIPVSSVLLQKKPVGTYLVIALGVICANPVSLPTGLVIPTKCTVQTSATLGDILKGLAYTAVDIAFDYLWSKIKGRLPKFNTSTLAAKMDGYLVDMGIEELDNIMKGIAKDYSGQIILRELANKLLQHIMKSWIASPIVTGGVRGSPGIGRGKAGGSWQPFGSNLW